MNNLAKWTLVATLAVLSACNNQPLPQIDGVGLLDISAVSKETGNTQQIKNTLKTMKAKLQADLIQLQSGLQEKIADRQKGFGLKPPTDEQKQELAYMFSQAQKEFAQAQEKAGRSLKQKQAKLVIDFRKKIQPVAKRVAGSKKLGTILLKHEAVILVSDPSVDITSAVIALMKKEYPDLIVAPEPATETQPEENAGADAKKESPSNKVTISNVTTGDSKTSSVKKAEPDSDKPAPSEKAE